MATRDRTRRTLHLALLPCIALLAACERTHDLSSSGCLPLRTPARVTLAQEAGLYAVRDDETPVLAAHPRNTMNDDFHGMRLVRTLPPGTPLEIARLEQAWGFDAGKAGISAFGTVAGGERFEYGWGAGTSIGRAPWEPASTPNLRTVACGEG